MLARTLLFNYWYASSTNLKPIHRGGWSSFKILISSCLVGDGQKTSYPALGISEPPSGDWSKGAEVRLQKVPFGAHFSTYPMFRHDLLI